MKQSQAALELKSKSLTLAREVIRRAQEAGIKIVDLRFSDLTGTWQHFSIPASELTEDTFAQGMGFDGSSIRGFQQIHESDMLLFPEPRTAFVDPTLEIPTLVLACDIVDPVTGEDYSRDPRHIARKAEAYLAQSGLASVSYWGPECEFYIFNSVRFDQNSHEGYYHIDSEEGIWNSGGVGKDGANLAHRPPYKGGYFPVPPVDKLQDVRSRIALALQSAGLEVEVHHHEVGTAGQTEIDLRFTSLTRMADQVMAYKYIVKNMCATQGLTATFMPKPLIGDNGSGMHVHQSLWDAKENLFASGEPGELSEMAIFYVGGLIKHAHAILAFAAPTTNSYKRLVPGYEAPVNLAYSKRNRSAICRIPIGSKSPKATRIEFRAADPTANPYLAFAAMLMAGLDGVRNRIMPPDMVTGNLYEFSREELAEKGIRNTPKSLREALDALKKDHQFLLDGGVFTQDVIDTWIALKEEEIEHVETRPHPAEFGLYYSA